MLGPPVVSDAANLLHERVEHAYNGHIISSIGQQHTAAVADIQSYMQSHGFRHDAIFIRRATTSRRYSCRLLFSAFERRWPLRICLLAFPAYVGLPAPRTSARLYFAGQYGQASLRHSWLRARASRAHWRQSPNTSQRRPRHFAYDNARSYACGKPRISIKRQERAPRRHDATFITSTIRLSLHE